MKLNNNLLVFLFALGMALWGAGCDSEGDCDGGMCGDGGAGAGGGTGEAGNGGEAGGGEDVGGGGGEDDLCDLACEGLADCLPDDTCPQSTAGAIEGACVASCTNGIIDGDTLYNNDTCEGSIEYVRSVDDGIDGACGSIPVTEDWGAGCEGNGGEPGVCGPVSECSSRGGSPEAGHCPGSENIQCCIDLPCSGSGDEGVCLDSSGYDCGVEWSSGRCPGGADILCCTE